MAELENSYNWELDRKNKVNIKTEEQSIEGD